MTLVASEASTGSEANYAKQSEPEAIKHMRRTKNYTEDVLKTEHNTAQNTSSGNLQFWRGTPTVVSVQ